MALIWRTNKYKIITEPAPTDPYLKKAHTFMIEWLNGMEFMELTTSGSTGFPKTIVISRSQFELSAKMTGNAFGIGKGTIALVCLNIEYIAGIMMLIRGLELDWELYIVAPSANPFLVFPEKIRLDFVAMVPMQLENVLKNEVSYLFLENVKSILLGGAPVSPQLIEKIQKTNNRVYQSYGMTETVSHIAIRELNPHKTTEYEAFYGVALGLDERGCLNIKGAITNYELVQTNDLVSLTSHNTFKWLGRADNVINSGGIKIVLDQIDMKVSEVFSKLGISSSFFSWHENDILLGQKLILFLEEEGSSKLRKTIIFELSKVLSRYETHKDVYFVQKFEKTATQKIDKRKTALHYLK